MGEIKWLYESSNKTPEQEVIEEEDKRGTELYKDIIRYQRANNVQSKDSAVAGMLNKLVAPGAGDKLQRSLGIGFLTRFMGAFKLGSANEDNLFIRLLSAIWNQRDGDVLKKILCGERPQGQDPNRQNNTQITKKAQVKSDKSNIDGNIPESLNEGRYEATTKSGLVITGNDADKIAAEHDLQNNQDQIKKSEARKDNTISQEEARILDMSARDLFLILYNGYLAHIYTGQDLVSDVDNDPTNNSQLTGKDGKVYSISPALKDIVLRSQNNEDAFRYSDDKGYRNNNSNRDYRDVSDLKDRVIRDIKNLSNAERAEVQKVLNQYK